MTTADTPAGPEYVPLKINVPLLTLAILGVASGIAGWITWALGASQLAQDTGVAGYEKALGIGGMSDPAIAADNTLIGWGIALVIGCAVLLVAALVVLAVRRPAA